MALPFRFVWLPPDGGHESRCGFTRSAARPARCRAGRPVRSFYVLRRRRAARPATPRGADDGLALLAAASRKDEEFLVEVLGPVEEHEVPVLLDVRREVVLGPLQDDDEIASGGKQLLAEVLDVLDHLLPPEFRQHLTVEVVQADAHVVDTGQGEVGNPRRHVGGGDAKAAGNHDGRRFRVARPRSTSRRGALDNRVAPLVEPQERSRRRGAARVDDIGRDNRPVPDVLLEADVDDLGRRDVAARRGAPDVPEVVLVIHVHGQRAEVVEVVRAIVVVVEDGGRVVGAGGSDPEGAGRQAAHVLIVPVDAEGPHADVGAGTGVQLHESAGADDPVEGVTGAVVAAPPAVGPGERPGGEGADFDVGGGAGRFDECDGVAVVVVEGVEFVVTEHMVVVALADRGVHEFVARGRLGDVSAHAVRPPVAVHVVGLVGMVQAEDVAEFMGDDGTHVAEGLPPVAAVVVDGAVGRDVGGVPLAKRQPDLVLQERVRIRRVEGGGKPVGDRRQVPRRVVVGVVDDIGEIARVLGRPGGKTVRRRRRERQACKRHGRDPEVSRSCLEGFHGSSPLRKRQVR